MVIALVVFALVVANGAYDQFQQEQAAADQLVLRTPTLPAFLYPQATLGQR